RRVSSLLTRRPPSTSTLFPYTTLFRSGDDLIADLLVGRFGDDLLLPQLVLGLVGTARDDLLRVGIADPGQRPELVLASRVDVELLRFLAGGRSRVHPGS